MEMQIGKLLVHNDRTLKTHTARVFDQMILQNVSARLSTSA